MRGPYGSGFPPPIPGKRLVLLGGGTGSAPIIMAARLYAEKASRAWFGFSEEIAPMFRASMEKEVHGARIVIDPPGSVGEVVKALSTDMDAAPEAYQDCYAFVCGPTPMMNAAVDTLARKIRKDLIFLGREDIMRCGIGLCGSCGTETGLRSCVDGPVMSAGAGLSEEN